MARVFLLLAIVLALFWWLGSRVRARRAEPPGARPSGADRPGRPGGTHETMVQCAHCGVHLPQSEAIAYQGLHYCRRNHLPDSSGDA